jgi:hypothetical protein
MVAVPRARPSVESTGELRSTKNVSPVAWICASSIVTEIAFEVSPGANVSVPLVGLNAVLVPAEVE